MKVRKLMGLAAIGINSAWLYVREVFGWRKIQNRRQMGSIVGLTPTPYSSGSSSREQGISRAGNRRMRSMSIEIAWGWLRYQPQSALSLWYQRRFGQGSKRQRRIGIMALARKLLVALWKYLERDEVPKGAVVRDWREKRDPLHVEPDGKGGRVGRSQGPIPEKEDARKLKKTTAGLGKRPYHPAGEDTPHRRIDGFASSPGFPESVADAYA